jgi:hypothetical protein
VYKNPKGRKGLFALFSPLGTVVRYLLKRKAALLSGKYLMMFLVAKAVYFS